MINLPQLTVVSIACNKHGETITALYKTLKQITPARVILFTDVAVTVPGVEVIKIEKLDWEWYNHFCIKRLAQYIETDFVLVQQWDGYVLNGDIWDDSFLNYDFIGAKWLDIGKPYNVGNGGFSLRSKKLQDILATDELISTTTPEDVSICKVYGQYLKDKYDIKFAPESVADKFAFELNLPLQKTFGFHGFHHEPYKETVVIKRKHALGDVIMLEPVLHYFYKKGYRVALDTMPEFMQVYSQHYFPVYPKQNLHPDLPYKEIDLDMAYENNPKQLVLKSYFEAAGITDEPLRNSQLYLYSGGNEKFFNKYVVIHVDDTGVASRNIRGIDWEKVVKHLEVQGYLVLQVGRRIDKPIATFFNAMNIDVTKYLIKWADLFIGIDSGLAQIAVAFDIPTVIFFGSVNPKYRYHDFTKISVVQNPCDKAGCYHEVISEKGQDCVYNKQLPPCTLFTAEQTIEAINKLL